MIDGIVQKGEVLGVEVVTDLIPPSNNKARPANPMNPKSITIHETGNRNAGADAKAHTEYVDNVDSYVSWHFTVDENLIIQELPINENAWHAGDGGDGQGNRTSIAIEICVNQDGNFGKAKENAKALVQYLMKELNISEIYPHKHWSGKYCPRNILNDGWVKFEAWLRDTDELEQLRRERDYWKTAVYDMLNMAEKTIHGGD